MIWSDRNKELYLSCGMFQMISMAFPPERDIWREFGSNEMVMRVSGRGRGIGRISFSLRRCAMSFSFFYFFPSLFCSPFSLRIPPLSFIVFYWNNGTAFILFLPCSPSVGQISAFYFSAFGPRPLLSSLYIINLPIFESTVKSNHKSSVWVERLPQKTKLFSWSNNSIIIQGQTGLRKVDLG